MQALKLPRAKRKIELGQPYECVRAVGRRFAIALALMCAIGMGSYPSPANAIRIEIYGEVHCPFGGSAWMGNVFLYCTYGDGDGSGGSSGGQGDGDGGEEPPPGGGVPQPDFQVTPISAELDCAISQYSAVQPQYPVKKKDAWAYLDANGSMVLRNTDIALPTGWTRVFGSTPVNGGTSFLYNRPPAFREWPYRFKSISLDPNTPGRSEVPPFTEFETDLMIAVHEIAHQNGIGVAGYATDYSSGNDLQANSPALDALDNSRGDSDGDPCT